MTFASSENRGYKQNLFELFIGISTDRMAVDYIKKKSPVNTGVEGRIGYLSRNGQRRMVVSEPGPMPDIRGKAKVKKVTTPVDSAII